jgi:hypothetical protein
MDMGSGISRVSEFVISMYASATVTSFFTSLLYLFQFVEEYVIKSRIAIIMTIAIVAVPTTTRPILLSLYP